MLLLLGVVLVVVGIVSALTASSCLLVVEHPRGTWIVISIIHVLCKYIPSVSCCCWCLWRRPKSSQVICTKLVSLERAAAAATTTTKGLRNTLAQCVPVLQLYPSSPSLLSSDFIVGDIWKLNFITHYFYYYNLKALFPGPFRFNIINAGCLTSMLSCCLLLPSIPCKASICEKHVNSTWTLHFQSTAKDIAKVVAISKTFSGLLFNFRHCLLSPCLTNS